MLPSLEALNANSLYAVLGIRLTALEDGVCRSELRPPEAVCWPTGGQPHGGVLFTQLDTTMATAVLSGPSAPAGCTTVSIDIQYLAPATGDRFSCEARVERRGGRTCFVRAETRGGDGELLALAQGTFRTFSQG